MRPIFLFDIVGTLSRPIPGIDETRSRSEQLFGAVAWPVVRTLQELRSRGNDCWIWSGMPEFERDAVVGWLIGHRIVDGRSIRFWPARAPRFRLRPSDKLLESEADLKRRWYSELSHAEKHHVVAAFDDRDETVAMWRSLGVTCFQSAPDPTLTRIPGIDP